jgi:hypothetical protein
VRGAQVTGVVESGQETALSALSLDSRTVEGRVLVLLPEGLEGVLAFAGAGRLVVAGRALWGTAHDRVATAHAGRRAAAGLRAPRGAQCNKLPMPPHQAEAVPRTTRTKAIRGSIAGRRTRARRRSMGLLCRNETLMVLPLTGRLAPRVGRARREAVPATAGGDNGS